MELKYQLEDALRRLHTLALRDEVDEFDQHIFVDNRQITQLETNDWQVIFGRRGTGKTTLLNAFSQHITRKKKNVYCLKIDMRQCFPSASGISPKNYTDFEISIGYFYEFIRIFSRNLFAEYTEDNSLTPLQKLIRRVRGHGSELDDLVLQICEIAEYQLLYKQPKSSRTQASAKNGSATGSSQSSSGSLSIDAIQLQSSGKITSDSNRHVIKETIDNETIEYIYDVARRYQPLKRCLDDLLRLIEADHLYILIDEWADLNRVKDDLVQPIFAELLRKTFSDTEKISIKIASIKGATRLNVWDRQGGLGLELGADIFEACDLDQIYTTEENSVSFFKELIFRRLCKVNKDILSYSKKNSQGLVTYKPQENFFSYLFKDEESLSDIVKGGGKIPRDFVVLFCFCAQHMNFKVSRRWGKGQILKAITNHSIQTRHETVSSNDDKGRLFYEIIEVSKNTGSRLFLVGRNLSEAARSVVGDLYHRRLIHPTDPSIIPLSIRSEYDCYYIDYGYFLEAAEYVKNGENVQSCPFSSDSPEEKISPYVVEIEDIVGNNIKCLHEDCGKTFPNTELSYEIRGLCPFCFRPSNG